jgi:hypothetical protein
VSLLIVESAPTMNVPGETVVVAVDWHRNGRWVTRAVPAAARTDVGTSLQVGDFGLWPGFSSLLSLPELDQTFWS